MRFSNSFLDEIRDRVPISQVVGQRVTFDRKKSNPSRGDHWACCPFHGEKSPSFHCEDRKGRYHCFGCGVSGDHFRFLTELDGMGFPEAVERIADMAGVPMPARDPEAEKREAQKATLYDVMDMATAFFEAKLQDAVGASARAYLRDRGLTGPTQKRFRMGYAPDSRNGLKEFLASKGVDRAQIEACGLVVFGPDIPVSYDRFRDRIMFPIIDPRGRVIAFGGRALSKDVPAKYLNSPETELFSKGRVLYNYGPARTAAQKGEPLIAVEGYMDVIALAQAGIESAVAPLGTALTEDQLALLWRVSGEPVLSFDGDQAGLKAAWRVADLALPLLKPGYSVRFALLPDGKDPDDLVKSGGRSAFDAVLADARPLADVLWSREAGAGSFDTPERRAELDQTLRALSGQIRDENVRHHYQQDFRERAQSFFGQKPRGRNDNGRGQERSGIGQYDGQGRGQNRGQNGRIAAGRLAVSESLSRSRLVRASSAAPPLREAALMMMAVNHPALIEENFDAFERLRLDNGDVIRIRTSLLDILADHGGNGGEAMRAELAGRGHGETIDLFDALLRRARIWVALPGAHLEDSREAFTQALDLHRRARALHDTLKVAEAAYAADETEENWLALVDLKSEAARIALPEALIEGFGVASGRGAA
jgi:DNA primase